MSLSRTALNRLSVILIPVLLAGFIFSGYYLLWGRKTKDKNESVAEPSSSSQEQPSSEPSSNESASSEPQPSEAPSSSSTPSSSAPVPSSTPVVQPSNPALPVPEGHFSDSLFIGDSRTEGLRLYGHMAGATFFSNKGMSINNVQKEVIAVEGIGSVNLSGALGARQFGKIYIMLGINEIGSKLETNAQKFGELISSIRSVQPNAKIIIEANLHVSAAKSSVPGTVFNNPRIDAYNNLLAALANGDSVLYINANPLFDDGAGNLRAECTSDGVHIYAKHYAEWAYWLSQN